jgi:protoporphyrinogen oxidase
VIKTDVLILGGGLAGLSTAYHLEGKREHLLVEKNYKVGGRAGSVQADGFTYDHTGHLLHLHDTYAKKFILRLLKGNVALHQRKNSIYSHGVMTRYPFQANTYGLPDKVIAECVAGFMKNVYRPQSLSKKPSFEEWSLKTFGRGISKHFMIPYNRKLWCTALSKMTTEWQGRFLPRPKAEEVLYGALTDQKKSFGYNAHFRYPVRGGCQALPDALAARVGGIHLNCRATHIDLREKVAVIDGLGEVKYRKLVNTMPLPYFLDIADGLPAPLRAARKRLRWVSVHNLNIGIKRANISDQHWIYFPEKEFPFYRAGFCSNFAKSLAPRGTSSMYIEVSRLPGVKVDAPRLENDCIAGLKRAGVLRGSDKLVSRLWIPIGCAYVVYDRARTPAVKTIMQGLKRAGVESIGRWGGWKYSFMEETILDGKQCAERLRGGRGEDRIDWQRPLTALK